MLFNGSKLNEVRPFLSFFRPSLQHCKRRSSCLRHHLEVIIRWPKDVCYQECPWHENWRISGAASSPYGQNSISSPLYCRIIIFQPLIICKLSDSPVLFLVAQQESLLRRNPSSARATSNFNVRDYSEASQTWQVKKWGVPMGWLRACWQGGK